MQFDQDTIKELAVYAVQQFVSHKTPLDESIAEKARLLRLNEEQVKRVIEATNVIAFLKLREGASDKTFEFEVASFDGVMDRLLGPASDMGYVDVCEPETGMDKVAFSVEAEIPEDQKIQTLYKVSHALRAQLEKVAQEQYHCFSDLERLIPQLVKQANWQERLEITAGKDFDRIMSAFSKSGFEKSASLKDMVFVGKELELANSVVGLIKRAGELSSERKNLEDLEKKASFSLGKLFGATRAPKFGNPLPPQDFLGKAVNYSVAPIAAAAGIAARGVGKGVHWAGKSVKNSFIAAGIGSGLITGGLNALTYEPSVNNRTGRPNDVWSNIYD